MGHWRWQPNQAAPSWRLRILAMHRTWRLRVTMERLCLHMSIPAATGASSGYQHTSDWQSVSLQSGLSPCTMCHHCRLTAGCS